MKTEQEIEAVRDSVNVHKPSRYPGMKYEDGVRDALDWILGDITDEEFELVPKTNQ